MSYYLKFNDLFNILIPSKVLSVESLNQGVGEVFLSFVGDSALCMGCFQKTRSSF